MRFIKANWGGYEIDSSEYATWFTLDDPEYGTKRFLKSLKNGYTCHRILENIENAYNLIKTERRFLKKENKLSELKDKIEYYKTKNNKFSIEEVVDLVKITHGIIRTVPHLYYEFLDSFIAVASSDVHHAMIPWIEYEAVSVLGIPIVQNWSTEP